MLKTTLNQSLIALIALLLLSACASHPQNSPNNTAKKPKPISINNLQGMNPNFLYLAAQDALNNNQGTLAIGFLDALVQQDPQATAPRLQLAELLLRAKQPVQALKQLQIIVGKTPASAINNHEQAHPYTLQIKAYILSGQKEKAHTILADLLQKQPDLLKARILQIRLWINDNLFEKAHASVLKGLALKQTGLLLGIQVDLYILQGKLKKADTSLRKIAKLDPHNEQIVLSRMQLAMKRGHHTRGEKILRNFIKKHPKSMRIRNALGRLLIESKRTQEAIRIYQDLVRDTGGNLDVLSALGLLYYQSQDFKNAVITFRKAAKVHHDDTSYFYLATSLEALQQTDEARLIFEKIQPPSSTYLEAQLRLAGMDIRDEHHSSAETRLLTLLKQQPNVMEAHVMLGNVRIAQKKYQLLLDETAPLLSSAELNTGLLFNRAIAFEHFKRFDDVETTLTKLLTIDANHIDALNFLGYVYADQGIKLKQAETLIRQALKQRPNDGYILDSLAWVYFKRGDYAQAIKQQHKALAQTADDPVIHEHLGDMLWQNKQPEAARKAWQKALSFQHENPDQIRIKIEKGMH